MIAEMELSGVDWALAGIGRLPGRLNLALGGALSARGRAAVSRLSLATPRRTGRAAADWHLVPIGFLQVAVTNTATSPRGFSYPSALITGTGVRGASSGAPKGYAAGYASVPGMAPAPLLRAAWDAESNTPLAVGDLLIGGSLV